MPVTIVAAARRAVSHPLGRRGGSLPRQWVRN